MSLLGSQSVTVMYRVAAVAVYFFSTIRANRLWRGELHMDIGVRTLTKSILTTTRRTHTLQTTEYNSRPGTLQELKTPDSQGSCQVKVDS